MNQSSMVHMMFLFLTFHVCLPSIKHLWRNIDAKEDRMREREQRGTGKSNPFVNKMSPPLPRTKANKRIDDYFFVAPCHKGTIDRPMK